MARVEVRAGDGQRVKGGRRQGETTLEKGVETSGLSSSVCVRVWV